MTIMNSPNEYAAAEYASLLAARTVMDLSIATEDPRNADVTALLETHLAFAHEVTPAGHVHALGVEGLLHPAVTFFGARAEGRLVGVGALRELDPSHGEIKSMHTHRSARGLGVGAAIVDHLLATARARGYSRVSLETGTMEAFAPARALYQRMGFAPCPPFADYTDNPFSTCMTLELGR